MNSPEPVAPTPPVRGRWRHLRWRVVLLAMLLGIGGGVMWWFFSRPAPTPRCHGRPLDYWIVRLVTGLAPNRAEARKALASAGPEAVPWLANLLRDNDPYSRRLLLRADPSLAPRISAWLHRRLKPHTTTQQRAGAATALGLLGDARPEVVSALRQALQDPSPSVWLAAAVSLASLGQPGGNGLLAALPELSGEARSAALAVLAPTNAPAGPAVKAVLAEAMHGSSRRSASAWGRVLGRFGAAGVPAAYAALETADGEARARGVAVIGAAATESYPLLREWIRRLPDQSVEGRLAGLEVLREVRIYEARCIPTFAESVRDPDPGVRALALKGLLELRQSSGLHRAVPILAAALADDVPDIRRTAAEALGQLGPVAQTVAPRLRKLAGDPAPEVRAAARVAVQLLTSAPPSNDDEPPAR